jgi:hypothetical protein
MHSNARCRHEGERSLESITESGDSDIDLNYEFDELELANIYDKGNLKLKEWSIGIKHNPLRHA